MAELVNLNKARKAKTRADARSEADRNRIAHGLTKAQKTAARIEADRARRDLDGKKRD